MELTQDVKPSEGLEILIETSGLEKSKATQITESLATFFAKAAEWDSMIETIVITSPEETGKMKMAKEGRLTLKNMRLEAEKIVKAKREEVKFLMANYVLEDKLWLRAGQMMEATFKNLETRLEEKEKFKERWEAQERERIKNERLAVLLPLGFQYDNGFDLGTMDDTMFQSLKLGLETAAKQKQEEEARLERERIEKEKALVLHNSRKNSLLEFWAYVSAENRTLDFSTLSDGEWDELWSQASNDKKQDDLEKEKQRVENERLRKEAEEQRKKMEAERANAEAEKKRIDEAAKAEREKMAAELAKQKQRVESLQREALTAGGIEQVNEAGGLDERQTAANVVQRIKMLADSLPQMESEKGKYIIENTKTLLGKVTLFIETKSTEL